MKTTSVTRLKNTLSARLKEVAAGETILITERRKPVAMLRALDPVADGNGLAGLYARGILEPPQSELDVAAFMKMPRGQCADTLTRAISEERNER
ncbi:MAG: type II toxin-antitoxin system Phd/YefM family antitoxin [Opitutales bacterium]|nr:type II toxin-antitoxin system Phd/YefM family antitoxin [Opitutales bacterium]